MNPIIRKHFDTVESRLVESPVIISYEVLKREIAPSNGKIRVKAILSDGGVVELFEYIAESDSRIRLLKYSFHWQDKQGRLRRRWDNVPHHLDLPNAPHHVHNQNQSVQGVVDVPNVFFVIGEIEAAFKTDR